LELTPLGDRALLITLGDRIDEATHRQVRAVCARLTSRAVPGLIELVPAFASVALHYDPSRVAEISGSEHPPYERFADAVRAALEAAAEEALPAPRRIEIPVSYGGAYGPDLDDVARQHDISVKDVVRLHSGATYRVYMLGFAPGFAYLGGLPEEIATPRRAEPRTNVPAGTVGIGGSQTGIYPLATPGGWQLIGRTPLTLFDATREPPTLLAAGDEVIFRPIEP
jgi:inhibitor of KinA